jgi:hypothetical protein
LIIDITIRDGRAITPEAQPDVIKPKAPSSPDAAPPTPVQPAAPAAGAAPAGAAAASPTEPAATTAHHSSAIPRDDDGATRSGPQRHGAAVCAPAAAGLALSLAEPNWRARISRLLPRPEQLPRTRFHRKRVSMPPGKFPPPT